MSCEAGVLSCVRFFTKIIKDSFLLSTWISHVTKTPSSLQNSSSLLSLPLCSFHTMEKLAIRLFFFFKAIRL